MRMDMEVRSTHGATGTSREDGNVFGSRSFDVIVSHVIDVIAWCQTPLIWSQTIGCPIVVTSVCSGMRPISRPYVTDATTQSFSVKKAPNDKGERSRREGGCFISTGRAPADRPSYYA